MSLATTQPMSPPGTVLTVFGKTDVGKVRTNNEDSFVVSDLTRSRWLHDMTSATAVEVQNRGVLLAVSDGMGGAQAGEVASALALHALRRSMTDATGDSAEAALRASVEKANVRVYAHAQQSGREGMGATLTAVLFHGRHAYIAEIGDSRAYLLRGARLVALTRDQSYVQHLLDAGTITRDEAETCEYKNVILQAVGNRPNVVVALNRLSVCRYDRFLLCSDGLSGKVSDAEMQGILASATNVQTGCDTLVALALERGGEDNITAIVAELDGEGAPALIDPNRVSLATVQEFAAKI